MAQRIIIANWKSNKILNEAENWIDRLVSLSPPFADKEIIIFPSFTLLSSLKAKIAEEKLPIKLGAQNISAFDQGPYTGEVNGRQLKEYVDYVFIGHSERRNNFLEKEEVLLAKVGMAIKYNITPVFFTPGENETIPQEVSIIVYEPPSAISTSKNPLVESPQEAEAKASAIKNKYPRAKILYGGSVSSENASKFVEMESINGVAVGHASLDPQEFTNIIKTC